MGAKVSHLLASPIVLKPVLLNSYQRSYYGTSNGQFRITIDHRLRYAPLAMISLTGPYLWEDTSIILELKYEEDLEEAVQPIRQYLPFRQTKSKSQ